jgi:hypothetical protein
MLMKKVGFEARCLVSRQGLSIYAERLGRKSGGGGNFNLASNGKPRPQTTRPFSGCTIKYRFFQAKQVFYQKMSFSAGQNATTSNAVGSAFSLKVTKMVFFFFKILSQKLLTFLKKPVGST